MNINLHLGPVGPPSGLWSPISSHFLLFLTFSMTQSGKILSTASLRRRCSRQHPRWDAESGPGRSDSSPTERHLSSGFLRQSQRIQVSAELKWNQALVFRLEYFRENDSVKLLGRLFRERSGLIHSIEKWSGVVLESFFQEDFFHTNIHDSSPDNITFLTLSKEKADYSSFFKINLGEEEAHYYVSLWDLTLPNLWFRTWMLAY